MSSQALVYAKRSSPITLTVESPAVGTPAANQVQPPPSPRLHTHSTQGPRGASRTPRSLPASTACQYQRKRIAPPHAARPVLPLRVHPWSGPSLTDTSSPPPPPPPPLHWQVAIKFLASSVSYSDFPIISGRYACPACVCSFHLVPGGARGAAHA